MKILVIIPALNEEQSIGAVIEDLRTQQVQADIVVVNDGSTDRTAVIAGEAGVTVLSLPYNLGIGGAMQTGYKYAAYKGYDIAVQFDGDGQHRADHLDRLIAPIVRGEADMVIGSRFLRQKAYHSQFSRLLGIKTLASVVSLFVGRKITDPTSGFRAVNRNVIFFFGRYYPDDYPEPEAVVLLHRAGFRVTEVPVLMRERLSGSSSITALRGLYYMTKVLLAIMIDSLKGMPRR
jgi:glycosyltransferase involved in cell wall biosynthesis